MLGVLILLLMIATAFVGYSLVWGQMSFWVTTVITNLFSAFDMLIPGLGTRLVQWIWGGFAVGGPTLTRLYSLHYRFPFVIVGVVVLHDQWAPVIFLAIFVSDGYVVPTYSKPSSATVTVWVHPCHSRTSLAPGFKLRPGSGATRPSVRNIFARVFSLRRVDLLSHHFGSPRADSRLLGSADHD
jgi:hypothetical protein